MKKFILGVAVAVVLLGTNAAESQAARIVTRRINVRVVRPVPGRTVVTTNYYRTNGVRYVGGYYYVGRNHSHWTRTMYSPQYRTTIYWDPGVQVWYYWDAPTARYYPVSYIR
jgi:hypothetical protein